MPATTFVEPAGLSRDPSPIEPRDPAAEPDGLAVERDRIAAATAEVISRMQGPGATTAALDRMTAQLSGLLAQAEEVRVARARAAARLAGEERRWRDHLEPA